MLSEAKTVYLHDVVAGGKRYHRYVEDFVNSHRHIDCDRAVCRNCHEMNIYIVKGLLTDCAHLIRPLFISTDFSLEECMELKRMYDTYSPESLPDDSPDKQTIIPPLSFDCILTHKQMAEIVSFVNSYHMFCTTVSVEDMEALFTCKEGFCLRVNNIRHVAILFDALLEHSFIQPYWQSVLERGRFLQSRNGTRFVSASSISTTLSLVRNKMTSAAYNIRRFVSQLQE